MPNVLKAEGRPDLFSFDRETEFKNIDRWVFDNKKYTTRNLEQEVALLRTLAEDYIRIIEEKHVTPQQLKTLELAISEGASGVWEVAISKLEKLAWHFEEAKQSLDGLIAGGASKTVERVLPALSKAYTSVEQKRILAKVFQSKNKRVRMKASEVALELRNEALLPLLEQVLLSESAEDVKQAVRFAINNMGQSEGELRV